MADDNIAVASSQQVISGAPTLIKTFTVNDPGTAVGSSLNPAGNTVEVQAVAIVNEYGRGLDVLTEATGQAILEMLRNINNVLADYTGCGTYLSSGGATS